MVSAALAQPAAAAPRITDYGLPTVKKGPWGITATSDAIWVASQRNPGIITKAPFGAPMVEYVSGGSAFVKDKDPSALATDVAGNVWYTKTGGSGYVGRITPGGVVSEWAL